MPVRPVEPVALTTTPTVSVVVPCYNYGHYLPFAVESIAGQVGVDVDVLIVDDCSTDDSLEVAEGLASRLPNVRVIRNEKNSRLIATANRGLATVTGKYALLISADDVLAPGALARATALMEANPDVGLVYGPVTYFTTVETPEGTPGPGSHWVIRDGAEWASHVYRSARGPIASPEAIVRTSTMREVGDYDPALPHTSDLQMWLRFAARAGVGFIAGTIQAYYRMHGANMSFTQYGLDGDRRPLLDLRYRMDAFESSSGGFPDGARFLKVARHRVADEALDLARRALGSGPDRRAYVDELVDFARAMNPRYRLSRGWAAFRARKLTDPVFTRAGAEPLLQWAKAHDDYLCYLRELKTGVRR
ncbi:glycosyltransferase [Humibacter sp. RRB41]|uniref:glycosyltransferase n=1 Tax=Humibacter sp. RRB41 TaxID=2919946 RepID=UPI001FA9BD72|nr:glycosyltransferase [Humibacter sp. RRB41]